MVIAHNVPALFTHLSMRRADRGLQQAMTRLSSGVRINSARDDAAGLAIANKLSYQVGGLERASQNSTHGISLIQTAEGALNEVHNMLQRMRELSVQAAHGTLTDQNRDMIQQEIYQLTTQIHTIARNTEYNRMRILNGEANRVIDNTMWDGAAMQASRSLVNTLFVSHQVQPGQLNYTIESAGHNAMVRLTPPAPGVTFPAGLDDNYAITINNRSFNLTGRTWTEVMGEINAELKFMGLSMYEGSGAEAGNFFLVSNLAGADQNIRLSGDFDLLGVAPQQALDSNGNPIFDGLGDPVMSPIFETWGADAVINFNDTILGGQNVTGGLLDINGNLVSSATLGETISGNNVVLRGSRGEEIHFNIQVMFDPTTGSFRFPGPDGFDIDELLPTGLHPDGLNMSKDFRAFGPIMLQIGPSHNNAMPVQIPRLNAETLGLVQYIGGVRRQIVDVRPTAIDSNRQGQGSVVQIGAEAALEIADRAIHMVSNVRARLGAYQNRLEATVRNLDVAAENTEQSRSRIQDTDMARESTRFAQYNVMFQAALSILGQANQRPQQIIGLLQ